MTIKPPSRNLSKLRKVLSPSRAFSTAKSHGKTISNAVRKVKVESIAKAKASARAKAKTGRK